ncbi:hypothetical protein N7532_006128 [Penicillium argentinense]|uniref:Uncharacterized protein n=1 Tax=Penicillium argentinense TaxID=1131581 RepID=A0A9W9FFP5_9EURO|nr:uncharacterized protein N7532_006128 [Penicillium argentinense]KAJ5099127.1 hypothetical protein N7532_006128 [Penicillium argentinense]
MARSDEKSQHGKKRPAEGDPDGAQPLTKRLGRLQLDSHNDGSGPGARARCGENPFPDYSSSTLGDSMLLDDTKHTTYIHDLDRELADSDVAPGSLVLSPLAARMLSVPDSVLANDSSQGKELVLYTEPSSLSVPREQDSVRRAIIESRARSRASKSQKLDLSSGNDTSRPPSNNTSSFGYISNISTNACGDDPMDIDGDS